MAKSKSDKNMGPNGASTTIAPTVRPDDPPPSAASPARAGRPTDGASTPARNTSPAPENVVGDVVAQVRGIATAPLRISKQLLPGRAPAYLGAGALLVAGVIDLPALVAGGLAYEALRRWHPTPS